MAMIYRKTNKGQVEIETRANRLVQRLRAALIMVDGRRSDEQLHKLIAVEPVETLQILLEAGYIEAVSPSVAATPPMPDPLATPGLAVLSRPEDVQRLSVRYLNDQLGAMAEPVASRIERAQALDELRSALSLAQQLLMQTRGSAIADEFGRLFIHIPNA
jgi:hypothetical protein